MVSNQTNRPAVYDINQWAPGLVVYLRGGSGSRASDTRSEGEHCSVLAGAEHVHDGLTHEQTNGDADCDCNHRSPNVDRRPIRCDTSRLGEAGLNMENDVSRDNPKTNLGDGTLTGTKNRTPVTIEVNAVPPIFLE